MGLTGTWQADRFFAFLLLPLFLLPLSCWTSFVCCPDNLQSPRNVAMTFAHCFICFHFLLCLTLSLSFFPSLTEDKALCYGYCKWLISSHVKSHFCFFSTYIHWYIFSGTANIKTFLIMCGMHCKGWINKIKIRYKFTKNHFWTHFPNCHFCTIHHICGAVLPTAVVFILKNRIIILQT